MEDTSFEEPKDMLDQCMPARETPLWLFHPGPSTIASRRQGRLSSQVASRLRCIHYVAHIARDQTVIVLRQAAARRRSPTCAWLLRGFALCRPDQKRRAKGTAQEVLVPEVNLILPLMVSMRLKYRPRSSRFLLRVHVAVPLWHGPPHLHLYDSPPPALRNDMAIWAALHRLPNKWTQVVPVIADYPPSFSLCNI